MDDVPDAQRATDSRRDAARYHRLLLALEHATDAIREMETSLPDIDRVLDRLLPDLARALNGEQAFVLRLHVQDTSGPKWAELTALYPPRKDITRRIEWSPLLEQIQEEGTPRVIDHLSEEAANFIPGLEPLGATCALLTRMCTRNSIRVVGVCNKADPSLGPYLASDRLTLDNIVELVSIGAQTGERRRQELESIQRTSAAVSAELDLRELLPMIAKKATDIFGAPAASLMLWDEGQESLVVVASEGLSDGYVRQRRIPKTQVYATATPEGKFLPVVTPDLRQKPMGQRALIERENLCSALRVPLLASGRMIGALNVYSTGTPREFSPDEIELTTVFANQAAIAIQNAQLRRQELEGLLATSDAIRATLDLDALLKLIVKKASQAFSAPATSLMLWDKGQANLIIVASEGLSKQYVQQQHITKRTIDDTIASIGGLQPIVTLDLRLEPFGQPELYEQENLCTAMSTPLLASGKLLGILNVYSKDRPRQFTPSEIELAMVFANQAATALEIAQLHQQTERRACNLETLQNLAVTLNSSLDLADTLARVCQAAVEFLNADHSGLVLFDSDCVQGIVKAEYPALGTLNEVIPLRDVPVEERLVESREPLILPNVAGNESLGVVQGILQKLDIQSTLIVPVTSKNGQLLGSFSLDAIGHHRAFTAEEVELCQVFAAHVAVAMENARLYSELAEAEEWREALIDGALDAMIAINQDKRITDFNRRAEEIFGWTAEEMQGHTVARLYEDVDRGRAVFEALNRGETVTERYVDLKDRDGTRIPVLLSATLVRDSQGLPIGQAGFVRDVRRVTLLEERLRALVHVSQAITGTLDQDQVLDQIVRLALKAFPKARNGSIHLYDQRTDSLHLQANTNRSCFEIAEYLSFAIGEGVAGWVYEHRQPAVVDNAQEDPRYKQASHPMARDHKSLVCVPLQVRDQVIGVLSLINDEEFGAFQADDLDLVSTFADQAAIAIDNARLYRETEEGRQHIRSLYEASNKLISPQDPDQVLQDVVEQARVAANATWVSVVLIDEIGRAQNLVVAGSNKRFDIDNLIRPNGFTMQAIRSGETQVIEDTDKERERVNPSVFQNSVAAALCLPLSLQGERIGAMWIHYDKPRRFSEDEIDALRLYVNQASIAYDNARRMQELEEMRQAAEAMSRTLEPCHALQQVVTSAAQVLHADSATIWSYDSVRDEFIPEELTATGMQWSELDEFRVDESKPGRTAHKIMREGYVAVPNVSNTHIDFLGDSTRSLLRHLGVQSFQGICLEVGDEKLGVLYVNYNRPRSFKEDEQETLRTFAGHASLALKNARLLAQMQRTKEAAQLIAGVTVQEDLRQTLRAIAQHTQQALHSAAVTVYAYDEATGRFGEWAVEISNPLIQDAARPSDQLPPDSAVGTILSLEAPPYYHLAEYDAQNDRLLAGDFVRAEGIKAAIGVQLRVRECRVGVIFVNFRSLHRFTSDEITTIQLFADQAAVAIRNAQLYQAEQQHRQALGTIQETSAAVSAVLDPGRLLPMITERAARIFAAPATSLMLWNESEEALVIQAAYGLSDQYRQKQQIDHRTVAELVKRGGLGPQVFDIGHEPIGKPDLVESEHLCNALVASLTIGRELIGILNIYSKHHPRRFDDLDKELAEVFANHAAIAIHNARLYEETVERSSALETLNEAGKAVTSSLALDEILEQIAEQAYRLTSLHSKPAHFSLISLVEGQKLRFAETHPREHLPRLLGQVVELDLEQGERIGVMGRAVKTRHSQLVSDVLADPDYVVYDPRIRSELAVPIYIEDHVIGVINVEHTEPNAFGAREQSTLESLAMQAATVIRHARRSELQQAVYEASKTIATHIDVEQRELLTRILEQAVTRIRWPKRPKAALGFIKLYDPVLHELRRDCVYPIDGFPGLASRLGEGCSLDRKEAPEGRIGISGRAMLEGKVQRVHDVRRDPDYLELDPGTRSELDAPLRIGDRIVGVLGLESDRLAAFDVIDEMALQALADLAAVVIQTARLYSELQQTVERLRQIKGFVGSKTAVDWIRMVSTAWGHSIKREVGTSLVCAELVRQAIRGGKHQEALQELSDLEQKIQGIKDIPITAPLSAEDAVSSVRINCLVKGYLRNLWRHSQYASIELGLDLEPDLDSAATIRASEEWVRRGLEIVVDNAAQAMLDHESSHRRLTARTRLDNGAVEILIQDTGPGIPEGIKDRLFKEPVDKPRGSRGAGIGLLLARTIFETYQGTIGVLDTGPSGTQIAIRLPVESNGQ